MAETTDFGDFDTSKKGASEFGDFATREAPGAMSDLATSVKRGVISGVIQPVVGAADLINGGATGKALADAGVDLQGGQQKLAEDYSPELKRQQAEVNDAKGVWETVKAAATNPRFVANAVVESVPSMLASAKVAGGINAAMGGMGAVGRAVAGGLGEGAVMAAQDAETNRAANPEGRLDERGYKGAALTGVAGAVFGSLGGALEHRFGVWNPETLFMQGTRKAIEGNVIGRMAKGAAIEGLVEEAPQSYMQQVGQNYAAGKPLTEGAAEQAAQGAVVGGAMGLGTGAMPGERRHVVGEQPPAEQNDPKAVAPVGPAQAAVAVAKASGAVADVSRETTDIGNPTSAQNANYGGTRGLIAAAAQRNGVDPTTALVISGIETGGRFNADAANPRSSARGMFQFMDATRRMFPEVTPEQWQDPAVQAEYGAKFIAQTNARMQQALGRAPTTAEAYMGHLLGAYGATQLLAADPNTPVQDVIAQYDPKRAAEIVRVNGMKGLTAGQAVQKWSDAAQRAQERLGIEQQAFPFASQEAAQMQAAAAAREGRMLEVTEHPNVPGRFAALPPMGGDPNEAQKESKVPLIADLPRHDQDPNQAQAAEAVQGPAQGQQTAAAPGAGLLPAAGPETATAGAAPAGPTEVASGDVPQVTSQAATAPLGGAQLVDGAAQENSLAGAPDAGQPANAAAAGSAPVGAVAQSRDALIAERGLTPGVDYNHQPTPAQAEAGNYKKVHESYEGLPLSLENPVGSERVARDGSWRTLMAEADYGYVKRTRGADSERGGKPEQVDVYVAKERTPGAPVFVFDQIDPGSKRFDEHKAVLGASSLQRAEAIYDAGFSDGTGPARRAQVAQMSMPEFKAWLKSGTTETHPASVAAPVVREQQAVAAGVLPQASEAPSGGLFANAEAAQKFASDNKMAAVPVQADGGFALAPVAQPWTPQVAKDEAPRLANLNRALGVEGDNAIYPLRAAPSPAIALAQHVAQHAFGVKVIPVESNEHFDGAFFGDRAYLGPQEQHPVLAVAGHEVYHSIENRALGAKLREIAQTWAHDFKQQVAERRVDEQFNAGTPISTKYAANEVVADLNGSMWLDSRFWSEMLARDQHLFRQVAYKFMELATKAVKVVTGSRFDASTIVRDVDTVRGLIAQAWADHLASGGKPGTTKGVRAAQSPKTFIDENGDEKPIRSLEDAHKSIGQQVRAAVAYGQMLAKNHDWDHNVGDQLYSTKTGKVYEITARSFSRVGKISENRWEPVYHYKTADGESGTFPEQRIREVGTLKNLTTPQGPKLSAKEQNGTRDQRTEPAAGAATQGLPQPGRVRGGARVLADARGQDQGGGAARPLVGLPTPVTVGGQQVAFGPFQPAHDAARAYMAKAGLPYNPPTTYAKVDRARAKRIADAFEAMPHDPQNPQVKAAYDAMIRETLAQYQAALDAGLKVEFIDYARQGDPYGNPRNAILDVVNNHHMWVFSTRDGFGTDATFDPKDNPLLAETKFVISGQKALANDIFRVVHDYFGHVKDGVGFRADGEENAWRSHSAMYSPLARRAMTTETRGQNSWLNFGPYGETNRTAKTEDTHFADQKIGILPQWAVDEGRADDVKLSVKERGLTGFKLPKGSQFAVDHGPGAGVSYFSDYEQAKADAQKAWGTDDKTWEDMIRFVGDRKAPTFYSALAQEVSKVSAKSLPVIGWKQQLTALVNKGLVKKDELYWTGIEEWLDARQQQANAEAEASKQGDLFAEKKATAPLKITPEEVMTYLAKGGVELHETTLSGVDESEKERWIEERTESRLEEMESDFDDSVDRYMENFETPYYARQLTDDEVREELGLDEEEPAPEMWGVVNQYGRGFEDTFDSEQRAEDHAQELNDDVASEAESDFRLQNGPSIDDARAEAENEWDNEHDDSGDSKFQQYSLPGGENYREVLITLPTAFTDEPFKSGHWDQKNVIAHTRLKDRYEENPNTSFGSGGSRVLFVEEIQSDWAQEGRKEGFNREPTPEEQKAIDEATREYREKQRLHEEAYTTLSMLRAKSREVRRELAAKTDDDRVPADEWKALVASERDVDEKINAQLEKVDEAAYQLRLAEQRSQALNKPLHGGVPQAPFVGKTDKWVELVLKRIIRTAVEEGYDKVAFATGQQNADRYSLRSEVSKIGWNDDNGRKLVAIQMVRGTPVIFYVEADGKINALDQRAEQLDGRRLDEAIGKEIADKVMAAKSGMLEGEGLAIGGEGMIAFYEKIIPTLLQKMLPKIGGDKQLQTIELRYPEGNRSTSSGRDVPHQHIAFAINDKMRASVFDGLPLFSRKANPLAGITVTDAKAQVQGKLTDLRPLALQALGGRQIAQVYQGELPHLAVYQKLAQQMQAGVNDMAATADAVVDRWGKLKDRDQLAALMHDATRAQLDPAKPYVPGDSASSYRELRARWDKLTPEARAIYAQARDMYEEHYSRVREAIRERIERAELSAPKKSEMLKRMDDQFFERIKGVYFPLARFGDYLVIVRDEAGKAFVVSREETTAKAEALRRELQAKYPKAKGWTVSQVVKSAEFNARRDGVGTQFLEKLFAVLDETGIGQDLQDEINQLVLASMPDVSWAKHGIHRKGTLGFSDDARRAFAQNLYHGAKYLQRVRFGDRLERQLTEMEKYVAGRAELTNSVKEQQVVDEVRKRHEFLMNPKSGQLAATLNSFGFIFHLGLSPATAIVNVTQTPLVALPMLGGKWGYGKATSALTQAAADTARGKNDLTKVLKGDELKAVKTAIDNGTIDVTLAHDLVGIAQGQDSGLMWKMRPVMRWASWLFHHSERFNRNATFLAAYRLARAAGTAHDAAVEIAEEYTQRSHFDYSSSNRPRVMQGDAARVFLQFKQYSQNMTFTLAENARLAMKGDKQAAKTLAGMLVMAGVSAGAVGIPVVAQLLSLASAIGGGDDEPWDAKVALQNWLAEALGQKTAEVLMHGVSRLGPADISGRVSLDVYKMWFPDVDETARGEDAYRQFLEGMAGPVVGGIGGGAIKALGLIHQGDWQRAMETILPLSPARAIAKAERFATEGVKDKGGVPIKENVSTAGVAAQALGFRPSEVANAQEGRGAIIELDKRLQQRRADLMQAFTRTQLAGGDTGSARAAIDAFNAANPTRRITALHLMQSTRQHQKRIVQAHDGVALPLKRRLDVMGQGRFSETE